MLMRTVYQSLREGLRMNVSSGANVGERLMAIGQRHYGNIRSETVDWLERVEMDLGRINDIPETFSGGMQQPSDRAQPDHQTSAGVHG